MSPLNVQTTLDYAASRHFEEIRSHTVMIPWFRTLSKGELATDKKIWKATSSSKFGELPWVGFQSWRELGLHHHQKGLNPQRPSRCCSLKPSWLDQKETAIVQTEPTKIWKSKEMTQNCVDIWRREKGRWAEEVTERGRNQRDEKRKQWQKVQGKTNSKTTPTELKRKETKLDSFNPTNLVFRYLVGMCFYSETLSHGFTHITHLVFPTRSGYSYLQPTRGSRPSEIKAADGTFKGPGDLKGTENSLCSREAKPKVLQAGIVLGLKRGCEFAMKESTNASNMHLDPTTHICPLWKDVSLSCHRDFAIRTSHQFYFDHVRLYNFNET